MNRENLLVAGGVRVAGATAALIGGYWLMAWVGGWAAHWSAAGAIIVKTNMALCQLLGGVGLLLLGPSAPTRARRAAGAVLALVVLLAGALTFGEHLFRYDLGIDQLLATEAPGAAATASPNRMGPPGSASLALLGAGLLTLAWGRRALAPYLGLAACVIILLPAVGFFHGIAEFYSRPRLTGIAWPTVVALLALGGGLVLTQRERGPIALLLRDDAGGRLMRQTLPVAMLVPLVIGCVLLIGERRGLYDTVAGDAMTALAVMLLLSAMLWRSAAHLSRSAAAEAEAHRAVRASEARLNHAQQIANVGSWEWDIATGALLWSEQVYRQMGEPPGLFTPSHEAFRQRIHPNDQAAFAAAIARALAGTSPYDLEFRIIRPDGAERVLYARGEVVPGPDDRPGRMVGVCLDITERKQMEAALESAARKYSTMFDTTSDGVWLHNLQGEILEVNDAYCRMSGYSRDELTRMPISTLEANESPEEIARHIRKVLEGGGHDRFESRHRRKDGTIFDVDITALQLNIDGGRMAIFVRDITERKRAERALRREAQFLAQVHDSVIATDLEGRITLWNKGAEQLFGYTADEALGRPVSLLYFDEDLPVLRDRVIASVLAKGEHALELRARAKSGRPVFVHLSLSLLRDEKGSRGMIGYSLDITERKRMETALRESEQRYRAIGESIDYGVWVCAPDGRNIYASPSFLRLVGLTQQQCADFGWGNVLHPDDAERTIAAWKECVRTGGTWDIEHRFRGVDGQWHPILARGVPVRDEQGRIACWAGINLDISGLKRTEAALREAQAKLQAHADELEKIVARRTAKLHDAVAELEHFSYTLVHDLRAPLRAMQSFADLIQEECVDCQHPLAQQYFRRIRKASSRMDQLITDSLNYSKAVRQELTLEPVDLAQLLPGLVESYPNLQPDKADIAIEGEFPLVLGNEAALTQCFSNLLGNAVKFVRPAIRPNVRVWAEPKPDRVRVWVQDNGIGIKKDLQPRLFIMFQRASNDYEGTGIGLAIVRKVVQRMGGEVGVESEEGQGSRFWVELARATSTPAGQAQATPSGEA